MNINLSKVSLAEKDMTALMRHYSPENAVEAGAMVHMLLSSPPRSPPGSRTRF